LLAQDAVAFWSKVDTGSREENASNNQLKQPPLQFPDIRDGAFIGRSTNKVGGTADLAEHRLTSFRCWCGQCKHARRHSMSNRFLISAAAAALIAGAGFAHAQGTGMGHEGPSAGSSAQHSAPSSEHGNSGAATNRNGSEPSSGMKATQERSGAGGNQRAEDRETQGQKTTKGMSSESEHGKAGKEMKAEGREGQQGGKDMKAEGREGRQGSKDMKAEGREGRQGGKDMKAEGREGQRDNLNAQGRESQGNMQNRQGQMTNESRTGQTTGQAGAGAKLSTEQRTKITSVIREQHVEPLNNVNFSIAVGTRVPRDVRFHQLPQEVVTVYPEWRGYDYVLVHDQIIVIDPRTYEIVAILET
jgi:hypothetical protein